ncbi:M4 family metallopeptidase [Streptomyces noursei]|uniref:Neutral metalloproteinase n=1 Tax=Streptomyces noursei TaxID=1971 RepID=A0A401R0K9_STRNR|nr:M4 family metallopeptidase [Streptomyces noursei]UWS72238.1 M4 family metallopeptidase [Streptomyces noursei]GCB91144.1 metalloprotease [Streptomyces noursei]
MKETVTQKRTAPAPTTPVFCTIVPPHILGKLAESDDPGHHEPARRTLEHDALHRTRRTDLAAQSLIPQEARAAADKPNRTIYDAGHQQNLPGTKVHAESDAPSKDASVNRAHAGLGATFELYLKVYGRKSIDGAGLPLDATVHYGEKYDNAFWDGQRMVFGDGDGTLFKDFTIPVDVIGHELTHGVTQYTANLDYQGQSGALNESVSDVFGSLIKQYALGQSADQADWLIGADLLAPGVHGQALRSMKAPGTAYDDPQLGKDPQPATMAGYVQTSEDNGGVHLNSGIPNHAFYLVASALGGKAWERAGQIWYDVLTGGHLTKNAQFADFANLTVQAAQTRYGASGSEHEAVVKAWSTVGVTGK